MGTSFLERFSKEILNKEKIQSGNEIELAKVRIFQDVLKEKGMGMIVV